MTWKEILEKQKAEATPEVAGDPVEAKEPVDLVALGRELDREARKPSPPPPVRHVKIAAPQQERDKPLIMEQPTRYISTKKPKQADDEDEAK